MHRFPDFNDSTFMSFWKAEGRDVLMQILADPTMIKPRYMGWQMDFSIDPEITKHDNKGNADVRAYMRQIENGVMSDMRAPLGDSLPMEQGNGQFYTAPIAHFTSKHFHETTPTMYDKRKRFEELREAYSQADAEFIAAYAEKVQVFLDGANMTLTHMGEQLMTKGYLYFNQGSGIHAGIYKAEIPAANFLKACMYKMSGSSEVQTTWADLDALMIDSLRRLVKMLNDHFGVEWQWQLDVPKAIWDNYIVKNKQVLDLVRWQKNVNGVSLPSVVYVTDAMVNEMLAEQTGLPKIVVHDTKQKDENNGVVSGWATGVVTMRPVGKAGLIRHTDIIDAEYFGDEGMKNPAVIDNYTPALYGLGYIENSIWPNGRMKEYRTRLIYSATPTLDEFLYHIIMDTANASDNGTWI